MENEQIFFNNQGVVFKDLFSANEYHYWNENEEENNTNMTKECMAVSRFIL